MKRNYGVDALRMCAMFMVVVLHVLAQGGILQTLSDAPMGINYEVAWFMEAMAFCAVNCFALISGYVGVETEFRWHKGLTLWLQIVFWTVLILIIYAVATPYPVGVEQVARAFLPVTTQHYWYVTAYFATFLFIPYINRMINSLSEKEMNILVGIIMVGASGIPSITQSDVFTLKGGYSFVWIAMLYLLGGLIKRLELGKNIKKRTLFAIYVLAALTAWGAKYILELHPITHITSNFLYNYTSFVMLVCAMVLLQLFAKLEIKSEMVLKIIRYASPLAFGVYIIHTNCWVWNYWLSGRFSSFAEKTPVGLVLSVLGAALCIYVGCTLMEAIRAYIFKVLKVGERCKKLVWKIQK